MKKTPNSQAYVCESHGMITHESPKVIQVGYLYIWPKIVLRMLKLCVHYWLAFIEVDIKPIINISFVREKKIRNSSRNKEDIFSVVLL